MDKQYVYILSNTSLKMKGTYKIGETKRHPEVRAHELSKETGVLGKYEVEWFIEVSNSKLGEKMLHDRFDTFRIEPKKEFFDMDLRELIDNSESLLHNYFKPIGKVETYRRKNTKIQFGLAILDDEKLLREWWQELPTKLKYAIIMRVVDEETYLRPHVEAYIEKNSIGDIYYKMKNVCWNNHFKNFNAFYWEYETIYEQDVDWETWYPEMLFGVLYEEYWWFREIINLPLLQQQVTFEDLQKMFSIEDLWLKNSEWRNDIFNYFPYLNSIRTNQCDIEFLMKIMVFPDLNEIDLGEIEIEMSDVVSREFNGVKGYFYPNSDLDKLRVLLRAIKSIANKAGNIKLSIGAIYTEKDTGEFYYVDALKIIKPAILEYLPDAIIKNGYTHIKVEIKNV